MNTLCILEHDSLYHTSIKKMEIGISRAAIATVSSTVTNRWHRLPDITFAHAVVVRHIAPWWSYIIWRPTILSEDTTTSSLPSDPGVLLVLHFVTNHLLKLHLLNI